MNKTYDLRDPDVKNSGALTNWFKIKTHKVGTNIEGSIKKVGEAASAFRDIAGNIAPFEGNTKESEDKSASSSNANSVFQNLEKATKALASLPEAMEDAVIAKDILSISLNSVEGTFIFPYPVSFKESYSQNYKESELSQDEKKLDMLEQGLPALVGSIPIIGSTMGASFSGILSSLRDGIESYTKRAGIFLDNNMMFIFVGPNPRSFEVTFNFPFKTPQHRDTVFKALKSLKKLALPTASQVFQATSDGGQPILPLRYLKMDTAFSFEFEYKDKKIGTNGGLNDILRANVTDKGNIQTQGFFLSSITTNPYQMSETGGFFYDGSPKGIKVTLSFVEAKTITRDVWGKPVGSKISLQKYYSNDAPIFDFITIGIHPPVSTPTAAKLKTAASQLAVSLGSKPPVGGEDSIDESKQLEILKKKNSSPPEVSLTASLNPFSDSGGDFASNAGKAVGQGLFSIADSMYSGTQKIAGVTSFTNAVSSTANVLLKASYDAMTEVFRSDNVVTGSMIALTDQKVMEIVLPIPSNIPSDELSNNYSSSSINNMDRAEKLVSSAAQTLLDKSSNKTPSNNLRAQVQNFTASRSMGRSIMKNVSQALTMVAKTSKEYMLKDLERGGVVLNPYTISSFQGTEIRKYSLSYNITFKSVEHFMDICKTIKALKYYMSPSGSVILDRPHMFSLSFNNPILDDYYGLQSVDKKKVPLNLTSISTTYDDAYSEEHGFPRTLAITLSFSELAPRRQGSTGYE